MTSSYPTDQNIWEKLGQHQLVTGQKGESTNKREKHPNSHRQNEKTENKEKSQHKQYNLPETFHILLNNES